MTTRLRSNMDAFDDLRGLARLAGTEWEEVDPPKNHRNPPPRREVAGFSELQSWSTCRTPLSGCLIRDTYPEKVEYQAYVTTQESASGSQIYRDYKKRWDIEEVFMALTRYWRFDRLPPCRKGVAWAMIHFALLAFTLLAIHLAMEDSEKRPWSPPPFPLPERELAIYVGPYFALLTASELMEIILDNYEAWLRNRGRLLEALRMAEGKT